MARIIVVDDDQIIANELKTTLALNGYEAWAAYTAQNALALIERYQPEVVILDLDLDGSELSGLAVLQRTGEISPKTRVIVMVGRAVPVLPETTAAAFMGRDSRCWRN